MRARYIHKLLQESGIFQGGALNLAQRSGAEAAKLKKFSAGAPNDASSLGWGAGGAKFSGCPTPKKTDS